MNTEYINRVELQGIIGSVRKYNVGGRNGFQLTLATNSTYKDRDGNVIIETQWSCCSGWEGEGVDTSLLEKGQTVHLTGRLRSQRYTAADGEERSSTEVLVHNLGPAV